QTAATHGQMPRAKRLPTPRHGRLRQRRHLKVGRNTMAERSGDVFGKRYGEVLLLRIGESGPEATVYNSFPLNDCPAELWDKLDAKAIAAEHGDAAALLYARRYWLTRR